MKKIIRRHVFGNNVGAFYTHLYYDRECNIMRHPPGQVPVVVGNRAMIVLTTIKAVRETGVYNN